MIILGIETSCDECAAAVVEDGHKILSTVVSSQVKLHAPYGGVIPELASRSHLETIRPVLEKAVASSGGGLDDIDAVAVTRQPGLIGSLLVGLSAAKGLAFAKGLPLVPVDHVEAHVYACIMGVDKPAWPLAALVVSGGHTSLYLVRSPIDLEPIGRTLDDAAGEAFDKVSAILGLGYPGGPAIEKAAAGSAKSMRYKLPRPLPAGGGGLDFSFSGLKTAVLYRCRDMVPAKKTLGEPPFDMEDEKSVAAMAAAFQEAVADVLVKRLFQAAGKFPVGAVAAGGGVLANSVVRERIEAEARSRGLPAYLSPRDLATDNAAMVAGLGYHLLAAGGPAGEGGDKFGLDIDAWAG